MSLPLHTRAFAFVAALSTTAAVITVLSEVGHPPPPGTDLLTRWTGSRDAARSTAAEGVVNKNKRGSRLVAADAGR